MGKLIGGLLFLSLLGAIAGCDRPEIPRSEYGQIIEEFPDFPHSPQTLPLPEEVSAEMQNAEP